MNIFWETSVIIIVHIVGIFYFMRYGIGAAIIGWTFLMFPGLVLIFVGITEGKLFYLIFGAALFCCGATLHYKDVKEQKEKFNSMIGKNNQKLRK